MQSTDVSDQLAKSIRSVYIAFAAYVNNVAKDIGKEKALKLLSKSFEEIGTIQGKQLKKLAKKEKLDANEAYELMKSIPKGIGVNFMITQKDSNKVVARLDKCPVYESSKLAGLEPGEFCNHSAIPYFRAVAKQLNMNLDYQQNKCKASEADFCEEQVFLKK